MGVASVVIFLRLFRTQMGHAPFRKYCMSFFPNAANFYMGKNVSM